LLRRGLQELFASASAFSEIVVVRYTARGDSALRTRSFRGF
jgi:hypothetical protein